MVTVTRYGNFFYPYDDQDLDTEYSPIGILFYVRGMYFETPCSEPFYSRTLIKGFI